MSQISLITTREAAERLQVTARTIRKWIDVFEDYICPDVNEKGHYLLSEHSLKRLAEIKYRLSEPNKTMKQVREELLREGKISHELPLFCREEQSKPKQNDQFQEVMHSLEQVGEMMEILYERMERIEDHMYHLFDSFEDLEQKLVTVTYDSISANEVHKMFDEIRKKQDQLKIELRNASFTQRLTSATQESNFVPRRQKKSKFLFFF